jgi:hypothetical protein
MHGLPLFAYREGQNLSELVAKSLCLPEMEMRAHLHSDFKVDADFLRRVADATGVSLGLLLPFTGTSIRTFYSRAVCGTTHFGTARGGDRGELSVPMAFQSALAGVLLAAEIVADAAPLRSAAMLPLTKLNLMKPLGSYLTEPVQKHASGRCLCQDPTYVGVYERKYGALTRGGPVLLRAA